MLRCGKVKVNVKRSGMVDISKEGSVELGVAFDVAYEGELKAKAD